MFLSPDEWHFYQKFLISTTSLVLQKWSYNLQNKWQNTLSRLIDCNSKSMLVGKIRRIVQKTFFYCKVSFFSQNIEFSTTSHMLEKGSYSYFDSCHIIFWTVIIWSRGFIILSFMKKLRLLLFFHCKKNLFFTKLFFQKPVRRYRIDLQISTQNVKKILWA